MKKRIALLLTVIMAFGLLAGCGSKKESDSAEPAQTESGAAAEEDVSADGLAGTKVAWVCNQSDAWHHQTAVTAQELLAANGYTCDLFDNKNDDGIGLECLEQIQTSGDYGLVIYANNVTQMDAFQKLMANGTSVVMYAIDIEENHDVVSTWVCSEYDLGNLVAKKAVEQLPENANVVVMRGVEGYSGSVLRGQGFHDALEEGGRNDITILEEKFLKFQKAEAMTCMEDWITAHGDDIDGVISENDDMALGAIEALRGAGIEVGVDGVLVYGIDGLYQGCKGIKEGVIQASAYQDSNMYAQAALERIQKLESGEMTPTDTEDLVFDASYIDETNVDEFLAYYEENGMAQ